MPPNILLIRELIFMYMIQKIYKSTRNMLKYTPYLENNSWTASSTGKEKTEETTLKWHQKNTDR